MENSRPLQDVFWKQNQRSMFVCGLDMGNERKGHCWGSPGTRADRTGAEQCPWPMGKAESLAGQRYAVELRYPGE